MVSAILDVLSGMAKRGLPHAHILIWLHNKITSNEIDDVISAEIPDENVDKGLYDIVVKKFDTWALQCTERKFTMHGQRKVHKAISSTFSILAMMVTHNIEEDLLKMAVKQQ